VGKTSILLRYVRGEYSDKQQSTLQASYLDKRLVAAGTSTQLSIWDTAGQERFHSLGPIYYRDAGKGLECLSVLASRILSSGGGGRCFFIVTPIK